MGDHGRDARATGKKRSHTGRILVIQQSGHWMMQIPSDRRASPGLMPARSMYGNFRARAGWEGAAGLEEARAG